MTEPEPEPEPDLARGRGAGTAPEVTAPPVVEWHKVAEPDDLPEGRVRTVTVDRRSIALESS